MLERTNRQTEHDSRTDGASDNLPLTDNARAVLERRYLRIGEDGQPVETVAEMFWRVARTVGAADSPYTGNPPPAADDFFDLLTSLRFFPNSPTFTGAGTPLGQLAACFVLPIEDDMGRDPAGIFSTLRAAALIQQTGGGNGFAFSRLRPRGDMVSKSAGIATGPVGFLHVYDTAFGEVAQGGTRRGANMAVLRVDHPDIWDFIRCKSTEGDITNFNISVGVTDDFMQAVQNDDNFDLVNPRDGTVWEAVCARQLFDEIVRHAHHNGEPGVLFLDTANRDNPVPHLYQLEATNPCGEQFLGPYENCCLGSINLARHVTHAGRIDWPKLQATVERATHFLDNVVSANQYVPAVPELQEAAHRARRIGLGIMGLADLMYHQGVRYGSDDGQELAAQVMEFVRYHCMRRSIALARERGPFPAIEGSLYDPNHLQWEPPTPLSAYRRDFGRPALDWGDIVDGIKHHGIRNAAQTTVAPTGTIATVAGCEGYGCEPVFALAYVRHVQDGDQELDLQYTSPLFEQALVGAGLDEASRQAIYDEVLRSGTCQHISELPDHVRHTFVVASDIHPAEHVTMQAAIQRFVDNSISKTCNFPADATVDDVAQSYLHAWELGCKGLTVYVTGTREKVVLETRATIEAKGDVPSLSKGLPQDDAEDPGPDQTRAEKYIKMPRPHLLRGYTYKQATPLGTAYVNVTENEVGHPFEVFLNVGKGGSDTAAAAEAIGRLISLVLRLPSPRSADERLREVVAELSDIGGGRTVGFGPHRVSSLPDGVAQALAEHLGYRPVVAPPLASEPSGNGAAHFTDDYCPDCGKATLVREEGCRKCYTCGFSEC
jgi:ribonucleoside-diphosphate reductase alpha chain